MGEFIRVLYIIKPMQNISAKKMRRRGPRSSWRSNRSFKVCVNRKGEIKHSFLTKTVSLVFSTP
jgi:hypothetical protein